MSPLGICVGTLGSHLAALFENPGETAGQWGQAMSCSSTAPLLFILGILTVGVV